jgi:hypothetical protein
VDIDRHIFSARHAENMTAIRRIDKHNRRKLCGDYKTYSPLITVTI